MDVGLKGQYNSEWDLIASLRVGLRRIFYTSHTEGPPSNFLSPHTLRRDFSSFLFPAYTEL